VPETYIIAEAGVNHNGSPSAAESLVAAAAEAGADAVKFQTFTAESLVTRSAPTASYQKQATGEDSQLAVLRSLELSTSAQRRLQELCWRSGIEFISSAFDLASVEFLAQLGVGTWKIPSGQLTDLPYLRLVGHHAASTSARVVLSTGMADIDEVGAAIHVLERAGVEREQIVALHCTTSYPTCLADVNLRAMVTLRETLGVKVGYSDHTESLAVPVAATALGAVVIEKHLTLSRFQSGPDHAASFEPARFAEMVRAVREVEAALGEAEKRPTRIELLNRAVVRKSIVARRPISRGEVFSDTNLTTKRPGTGLSPMLWDQIIGCRAARDYMEDELVDL
jgi:N-acetylneuraminate synthase